MEGTQLLHEEENFEDVRGKVEEKRKMELPSSKKRPHQDKRSSDEVPVPDDDQHVNTAVPEEFYEPGEAASSGAKAKTGEQLEGTVQGEKCEIDSSNSADKNKEDSKEGAKRKDVFESSRETRRRIQIQLDKRDRAEIEIQAEKRRRLRREDEFQRERDPVGHNGQEETKRARENDCDDAVLLHVGSERTGRREIKAIWKLLSISAKDKVWHPELWPHHPDDFHEVRDKAWDDITGAELDAK